MWNDLLSSGRLLMVRHDAQRRQLVLEGDVRGVWWSRWPLPMIFPRGAC